MAKMIVKKNWNKLKKKNLTPAKIFPCEKCLSTKAYLCIFDQKYKSVPLCILDSYPHKLSIVFNSLVFKFLYL